MDASKERARLVKFLKRRGIKDKPVLHAFRQIPRELFFREETRQDAYDDDAYDDDAYAIGHAQTISQPYVVAPRTTTPIGSVERESQARPGRPDM